MEEPKGKPSTMAQVLIRELDVTVIDALKRRAASNRRSLQAELKAILEEQAYLADKAESHALAERIRQRIASRPQTDSGCLQAEDRYLPDAPSNSVTSC
jgi:plasmid stability protein